MMGNAPNDINAAAADTVSQSTEASRAARRRREADALKEFNVKMRQTQEEFQRNKYYDNHMSPLAQDPANFETRLPTDDKNYVLSPAAKRARQDGSLDPTQTYLNRTINRKLKMRDTFTKIFPSYTHGVPTCYAPSNTHAQHFYPKKDDLGNRMQEIDRTNTHKMDFMKEYTESMLKIANMRCQR